SRSQKTTPSVIQENVGLAKSNITILCNNLIKEGLMTKTRDEFDTREIYFQLTESGKKCLDDFLFQANKNFTSELAYKNNESQIKAAVDDLMKLVGN
ncbi:MAG: winged helix-turn-helix transcriptional regulator, partial [Clostridia bacterium]|nr:winged helix-turn-helix transcriptional regulator [Clostridia bacterium]